MKMGNSSGHPRFSRKDSKRFSRKKYGDDIQQHASYSAKEDVAARRAKCFQRVKESLAAFELELDSFDKEEPECSAEIECLKKSLAGHTSNVDNDDETEDMQDRHRIDAMKENVENISLLFQKLSHWKKTLKDSFKTVRSEIDKCEDVFEESEKYPREIKRKHSHKQNPVRESPHHNTTDLEENGQGKAKIQILFTQDGPAMQEAVKELENKLARRIGSVEFIDLKEKSNVDVGTKLIIVCIVCTRFGADAKNAVENIKNQDNVALLLIHVVEPHAVTNKNSSLHLKGKEFANLQGIFDMSFKTGNGFFQCDMNDRSIDGLTLFCKPNHKQ